jgi:hypothetical protein
METTKAIKYFLSLCIKFLCMIGKQKRQIKEVRPEHGSPLRAGKRLLRSTKKLPGLRDGKLTKITQTVIGFAGQFKGNNAIEKATEISLFLKHNFRQVVLSKPEFDKLYLSRTAEQIIKDRTIFVHQGQGVFSVGCNDYAHVLCVTLRYFGIPSFFVRAGTHSFVIFRFEGKNYIADPAMPEKRIVRKISRLDERIFGETLKEKRFSIGTDAIDIGMRGIKDYDKQFE